MTSKEKFKCDYCPSLLSNKANKETHMKTNKSCLKKRGIISAVLLKSCLKCGFNSNNHILGHKCRPESIAMVNKIKLLNITIDKLNYDIKGNKLDHKDIISDKNDKYKQLEQKLGKSEAKYEDNLEKLNNEIFNLERDTSLTIDELKAELKEYKSKIFDIASKPSVVHNATTNNTNNIQMLIQKLVPVSEHEMIKLFETVCTKEIILNGVDTLMEELGSAMKNNHMLCTDTNRNKLTYKNDENKVIKDTNGKVILPQLCKWGQSSIDKGYLEAEKVIKHRTTNEEEYDSQMKYLDKEWQYKYSRIKSGIGEKESKKAAKIIAEKVKIHEQVE
jgi:hypothetical protein